MRLGLYIHLPFCLQKCFYCDFPSYMGLSGLYPSYIAALRSEIAAQGGLLPKRANMIVDTVFFGGGTPTVLSANLLLDLIQSVKESFTLLPETEFTIEANPGTTNEDKLQLLRQNGVNRISFGVQSFDDVLLRRIGRVHTAGEAEDAIRSARRAGFENISLDLMYGLPRQTLQDVACSVERALELDVDHISIYGLKVEDGTIFAELQAKGALVLPDEETEESMYAFIVDTLPAEGYQRYEISNFAKAGFESRHNMKYWQDAPYLGLGAAAHSYLENRRYANLRDVKAYIVRVNEGKSPSEEEIVLTEPELMEEFCFLALRTRSGICVEQFNAKFNCDFFSIYGHTIECLKKKELIECNEQTICLTKRGMKYGNRVFIEFLLK